MPGRPYEYLVDPVSGRRIRKPFSLFSGPIPFGQPSRRKSAPETRLLVIPNPDGRSRVRVVPTNQSYEDAMRDALMEVGPEHFELLASSFRRWWEGER